MLSGRIVVCALKGTLLAAPDLGLAQFYPSRPIRAIVPTVPGGGGDTIARAIGQKLSDSWGQQIVVDNRTGIVGAELAARAAPDGYTVMVTTSSLTLCESVSQQPAIDALRITLRTISFATYFGLVLRRRPKVALLRRLPLVPPRGARAPSLPVMRQPPPYGPRRKAPPQGARAPSLPAMRQPPPYGPRRKAPRTVWCQR